MWSLGVAAQMTITCMNANWKVPFPPKEKIGSSLWDDILQGQDKWVSCCLLISS